MATRHASEALGRLPETLVVRGILSADNRFVPVGCHSARLLAPRKAKAGGDILLELFDREGHLLLREPAAAKAPVVCAGVQTAGRLVEGRMPLPPGAVELRLSQGTRVIERFAVGEPPRLEVQWRVARAERGKKYPLLLQFSDPAPEAHIKVLYEWAEGRYLTAALTRPVKRLEVDFEGLPGGEACRLIVAYTSGMRSAAVATAPFAVPPLPPSLRIVRPRDQAVFAPWHPVTLEAELIDRQSGADGAGDLVWSLNGKTVAAGSIGCLQALPEGSHEVEVQRRGGAPISARCRFEVRRPEKAGGIPPDEWD